MRNRELLKMVAGFRRFRERYFDDTEGSRLAQPQTPKTLLIGCSDSRVDPALLSSASPGELFIVRNVANLVPPYESSSKGRHGVSAAIEFAVVHLKVENIVILGHRQCGGIRALMAGPSTQEISFVSMWMEIARKARENVLRRFANEDFETQCKECEMEAIVTSIENLKTFPFVREALDKHQLNIFGIYFDLELGLLREYDEGSQSFQEIKLKGPESEPSDK